MDFLNKNKTIIGVGIALLLVVYVYFTYFSGSSSAPTLTTTDTTSTVSQNLLVTLQNLHTIKLDNTIFTNPVFISLTDFGVTIPLENVGRRNPFLPLQGGLGGGTGGITLPKAK
jgi:hypothetical protein